MLTYSLVNTADGMTMNGTLFEGSKISGQVDAEGTYTIALTVSDSVHSIEAELKVSTIGDIKVEESDGGSMNFIIMFMLALFGSRKLFKQ